MNYFRLTIITSIILAAVSETVLSQKSEIGFKGGLNIYSLKFDDDFDTGNRSGFHYGFLARFYPEQISPVIIQTEIIYSQQGVVLKSDESMVRLNHINVPILVQYQFENGLRVQAGPQLGFLMNVRADYDDAAHDIKNRFRKADWSVTAGFSYPLMSSGLGIDIRYNLGLSKISTDHYYRSRNRGLQIGLFYLFDFSNHSPR